MMEIPISAVFETPTVRSLANVTRELEVEKGKSLMIAKIFNEVDGLDSDEVARILRVQGGDSVP